MNRTITFLVILVVIELVLVWRPFDTEAIAWQNRGNNGKVAGQIIDRFHLSQNVPSSLLSRPMPKKRITHWWRPQRKLHAHAPNCFALRFATYHRQNSGYILVGYTQGTNSHTWKVNAAQIDNDYRRFCPDTGLRSNENLLITVQGLSSKPGQAVTAWLNHSPPLEPAMINGQSVGNRSLNLRLVYFQHVDTMHILGMERGKFLLACILSLLIALVSLLAASLRNK